MKFAAFVVFAFVCSTTTWLRSVAGSRQCICTKEYDPVCGADGKTYGNPCEARCAGTIAECEGECPCPSPYKRRPIPRPPGNAQCGCPEKSSPVCGLSGVTYENSCYAKCYGDYILCDHTCPCTQPCDTTGYVCFAIFELKCPAIPEAKCHSDSCGGCGVECFYNGLKVECDPCKCTENYNPVCGVDNKTYDNECRAKCEGVEVDCDRQCPCRSISDSPKPCVCTFEYAPVCGSDGNEYSNTCAAECAGVSVECEGECPCRFGLEVPICPDVYQPVCGYDGITYGNECEAGDAKIECEGECPCKAAFSQG